MKDEKFDLFSSSDSGLRRREVAAHCALWAQMQEGAIEYTSCSGRSLRRDRTSWQRAAGLRGAKLRPANRCAIDPVQKARSQADGHAQAACGREHAALRPGAAADRYAIELNAKHPTTNCGCGLPVLTDRNDVAAVLRANVIPILGSAE